MNMAAPHAKNKLSLGLTASEAEADAYIHENFFEL